MSDGPIDTKAPEEKPYNTQNTMIGALDLDGNHNPNTIIAENAVVIIMVLNRPKRSAKMPGRIRPNILRTVSKNYKRIKEITYEAALSIGIRYIDKFADMPNL
jgi:hypothetical protein